MLSPGLCVSLLAASCALWPAAAVRAASCESVRIPLCASMPWNMTKMPNHLHHSTQDNAVLAIEQYEGLLGTACSPDLLFFLCAMYAPICTIDFQHEPIKPCKAVCERAKQGCEPVMKRYNHSWPDSLACSELPLYDRGVCISPEAIVKAEGPDPYHQDPARCNPESSPDFPMDSNNLHCRGPSGDRCKCKTVKMGFKNYQKNNYNYVIRARVREVRNRGLEPTAVVEVKEVLKSSLVNIPRETQTLYYSSSCLCPPLSPGEEYLIMGYENGETSRLLLIDSSIVQKWNDKLSRKIKRWNQTLLGKGRAAQRRSRH
ncbi:frzb [Pungitius sinensis]